jgi:hypothetical protein
MEAVRVARDRWNFELVGSGRPIMPLGGNMLDDQHPGQGTLFDRYDAQDVDRRFGLMAELGLNVVRQAIGVNHVFDARTGLKAAGMKQWDSFIGLAEKHGVYLMPVGGYVGGNDWFDAAKLADHGRCLDESCAFWAAFAGHYGHHPAIWAWDLRNELLYDTAKHMTVQDGVDGATVERLLRDRWPAWLAAKYGTVAVMNHHYQSRYASFAEVPGSVLFVERPCDRCADDFRHYLNDRGYDWCKRQCDVLREVAPGQMIVSGNNGWLFPDMDLWLANGFHNRALHDLFDFISIHPYPAPQCLPTGHGDPLDGGAALRFWLAACIVMARLDYYGKPVVLQEFGWYGGGESRFLQPLRYRSEQEHADYTRTLITTLLPHANGFINWPTFDMPRANDISNHGGIFTHDGRRKALAAVYGDLARRQHEPCRRARGTTTMQVSLLGLHTSRPYQDRFWEEAVALIHAGQIPDFRFL